MKNWTGDLRIDVEEKNGKTIANNIYFNGALKVMKPIYPNNSGQLLYYILNPGGGYFDSDRYRIKISLTKNAQLALTTQSATKIYKTPKNYAYQESEFIINENCVLEYIPDPIIAYKNAKFKQRNVFRMDKSATLIYSDIITPGWSPKGDPFSYDLLHLRNEVFIENELVVFDQIKICPFKQKVKQLGYMESYSHLGSMLVIGEKTNELLLDRIYEMIEQEHDHNQFKMGLSLLSVPGFSVRVLSYSTQKIESILMNIHKLVSNEWLERAPQNLRKY